MKIFNLSESDREIKIIPSRLPEMLLQRNQQELNNSQHFNSTGQNQFPNLVPVYMQSNIRPRKGTNFSAAYNNTTDQNYLDNKMFPERKNAGNLDFPTQKSHNSALGWCVDLEIRKSAADYCQKTTLHGLKYVGDEELHIVERLFWTIAFVLGVLAAAYFITLLYRRWDDNPMIISLSPRATLLESIPFPAVTICNMNGARKSIAEKIDNESSSDPESKFERHMLGELCGEHDSNPPLQRHEKTSANWSRIQNFLIKVSQPCHEMLASCKWKSKSISCNDIFNPELTDEGMCCSFNKVARQYIYRNPRDVHILNYTFPYQAIDWTPEKGYPADAPPDANPWRPFGAGKEMGLTVVLDADLKEYYCSSTASVGFKLLLHNPIETPKISDFAYFLTPGLETRVEIIPKISTSTPNLVNIPQNKRQCIFTSDRELRFYRTYTQRNCELECQSNFTLRRCRCVPFYLPKDNTTRICGTADEDCIAKAKAIMEFRLQDERTNVTEWEGLDIEAETNCSCLPSCTQIRYTKQMSSSKLDDSFAVKSEYLVGREPEYFKGNMSVVHFFFIDTTFTGFEKGEIFGFTDFLSNTGGLLGLFLGFSFMSAAEVAYFMTLRLFCLWNRKRRKNPKQTNLKLRTYPFIK